LVFLGQSLQLLFNFSSCSIHEGFNPHSYTIAKQYQLAVGFNLQTKGPKARRPSAAQPWPQARPRSEATQGRADLRAAQHSGGRLAAAGPKKTIKKASYPNGNWLIF